MTPLSAIFLGLIEGFTEFLPISSTGHLILAEKLLAIPSSPFVTSFTIAIQLGAILAVLLLYGQKLLISQTLLLRLFAAFVPTAISGTLLYGIVKSFFLNSTILVLWSMFAGGVLLLVFELFLLPKAPHPHSGLPSALRLRLEERASGPRTASHLPTGEGTHTIDTITYRQAIGIGLIQSFAMIPGVSRSAASIIGGLALGLSRKTAVEFSFLLAIPTMIAATSLDLAKNGTAFSGNDWFLLVLGAFTAFLTALATIRWFLQYLQHHTFMPFALYRIVAALFLWVIL